MNTLKKATKAAIVLGVMLMAQTGAFAAGLTATAHVQDYGWLSSQTGEHITIGTTGESKRMEAFTLQASEPSVSVTYQGHVEDYGWMSPVSNGAQMGTTGERKRIECFRISLEGEKAGEYNIWYRSHVENYGWLDWAKNGESSGTANHAFRCEALEIALLPKDAPAPGSTDVPAVEAVDRSEGEHMGYVNLFRKTQTERALKHPYLTGDPMLHAAAQERVKELKVKYDHTRPDGSDFTTAYKEYLQKTGAAPTHDIYSYTENICSGATDPYVCYQGWLNSPGHRSGMLNTFVRYMAFTTDDRYALEWFAYLLGGE